MPLKKPSDLFEEKIEVETPVKVEELQEQTDSISSSLTSSLTEAIDKNLNILSKEYSEKLNKFDYKLATLKEEINIKLNDLENNDKSLKGEIGLVDERQGRINIHQLKQEVTTEIKKLEDKIETIKEAYEEHILNEGLLNEPPSTDNEDLLTSLDQKFITLDKFEEHYKLFVNRIQKQLSTLGGGGAVNIRDLDDVDQSSARVNNKYLKYNSTTNKWEGADASGGSGIGTENVSTNSLNVVGISTFNDDVVFKGNTSNAKWDSSTNDLILFNNTRLEFGDNKDFEIWHGGSHTFMKNSGGDLRIRGDVIKLAREDSSERYIECNVNNAVQIFHNGTERFTTTSEGISVTGLTTTTNLSVAGVTTYYGDVNFPGASYNIHWDQPTSKFKFDDSAQCVFGSASGGDMKLFHQSGNSTIRNETGQFRIAGNDIRLQSQNHSEDYILCTDGADVKLFFNDAEKLATTNTGINVTGDVKVGVSTAQGVILTSPNGTEYRLIVADDGTLSTTAV